MKNRYLHPLFLGLTHIGQVFSIGWSEKFDKCAVYDFNIKQLKNFNKSNLTDEEPDLKKLFKKNKKKIHICNSPKEIRNYKNIFLTIDTPLKVNGKPNYNYIKSYIKKSLKYFEKNTNIIITSQVYCGFCDEIKRKILKQRPDIQVVYMAETLIMGNALNRFLKPERLIFGTNKKIVFFRNLKKFKCPIFILSYKQAEMVKMAINLFLMTSVTYANLLDFYCREFGFKFSSINRPIKLDRRIGSYSYISPSLGVSGGHLERDLFSIIKTSKNNAVKNIFTSFKSLNQNRISILIKLFKEISLENKIARVVWVGPSYKQDSFSILNSPFYHFRRYLKSVKKKLFVYDSHYNLKEHEIENIITKITQKNFYNSIIILNYANSRDLKNLLKISKKNNSKIIDIRFSSKILSNRQKKYY